MLTVLKNGSHLQRIRILGSSSFSSILAGDNYQGTRNAPSGRRGGVRFTVICSRPLGTRNETYRRQLIEALVTLLRDKEEYIHSVAAEVLGSLDRAYRRQPSSRSKRSFGTRSGIYDPSPLRSLGTRRACRRQPLRRLDNAPSGQEVVRAIRRR